MKWFVALFLSICATAVGYSQSGGQDDHGKWEIGLNVLPLFDSRFYILRPIGTGFLETEALANTVLVKRAVTDRLKLRAAAGLKAGRRNRDFHHKLPGQVDLTTASHFGGHLAIGAEAYMGTGKISFFLGTEAFGTYVSSETWYEKDTRPHATPPTIIKIRNYVSVRQYGMNALAGISVRIVPHLFLSLEAMLQAGYRREFIDFKQIEGEAEILTALGGDTHKLYFADLRPISAFNIIYQF